MQMRDLEKLLADYEEAKQAYEHECRMSFERIIRAYETGIRNDVWCQVKKEIGHTNATRLAMQSAQHDYQQCLEYEANVASFKEDDNNA